MKRGLGLIALVSLMATGIIADQRGCSDTDHVQRDDRIAIVVRVQRRSPDQVLGLVPGKTYQFLMSAADASAHPFFIATTTGVEPPTPFVDPGLTGNGTANIMFTVPTTPIPQIFYQCSVHSFMTNKIVLNATAAPALDGKAVVALAVLLLSAGVGAILLQRRKRTTTLVG